MASEPGIPFARNPAEARVAVLRRSPVVGHACSLFCLEHSASSRIERVGSAIPPHSPRRAAYPMSAKLT